MGVTTPRVQVLFEFGENTRVCTSGQTGPRENIISILLFRDVGDSCRTDNLTGETLPRSHYLIAPISSQRPADGQCDHVEV